MGVNSVNSEPIFIAGPDRSGTSLMYALLASHPNISMVRRTNMWRYFHLRYGDLSQSTNFERCLTDMVRYNRMKHLQPNPDRIRCEYWEGKPSYGRLFSLFHQHNAERIGKSRWGDKSLHTEHYADRVFAEFPNAKILHMSRDPRDRYASVKKRHGQNLNRVGASTGRWLFSMQAAHRNLDRYPRQYMIVRYEMLAQDTENTLKQICAFINEDYSPAMLTMEGASQFRDSGGNSSFGTIAPGTISTNPVGRFRTVLSAMETYFIQTFTRQEMIYLGYQFEDLHLSNRDQLAYALNLPVNVIRMHSWMILTASEIRRGEPIPRKRLLDIDDQLSAEEAV
jgi:hypothetical protein